MSSSSIFISLVWFLPILNKANVCIISKNENIHLFDLINLINYREEILSQIRYSEGKLPYHIGLKVLLTYRTLL